MQFQLHHLFGWDFKNELFNIPQPIPPPRYDKCPIQSEKGNCVIVDFLRTINGGGARQAHARGRVRSPQLGPPGWRLFFPQNINHTPPREG
jgi:hypothetical protein